MHVHGWCEVGVPDSYKERCASQESMCNGTACTGDGGPNPEDQAYRWMQESDSLKDVFPKAQG